MNSVQVTQQEMMEIVLHLMSFGPVTPTRSRLIEVARDLSPNNELYVLGQSAITEAAMLKRDLVAAKSMIDLQQTKLVALARHIDNLTDNDAGDSLNTAVEHILSKISR